MLINVMLIKKTRKISLMNLTGKQTRSETRLLLREGGLENKTICDVILMTYFR